MENRYVCMNIYGQFQENVNLTMKKNTFFTNVFF